MALNFSIYCGGKEVERQDLRHVETPRATQSHVPVPHSDYVDMIEDAFRLVGLAFGEQAHAVAREGNQYFGMAEVVGDIGKNSKWATVAGFRGSHDKSIARELVIGDQVFVCDNLCFFGEIKFGRKHTTNIMRDLPDLIHGAVAQIKSRSEDQAVRYERYQVAQLKDSVVNHTIIQMLRQGVINTQRVEKVVNEYYEPSHVEFLNDNGERTIWTLHNAVTESLKGIGPNSLPRRTIQLQDLLDKATDYALAA